MCLNIFIDEQGCQILQNITDPLTIQQVSQLIIYQPDSKDLTPQNSQAYFIFKTLEPHISKSASKPKKRKSFTPPTLQEITDFVNASNSPINPSLFFNYYQNKGWKLGKSLMTDWKATLKTWELNASTHSSATQPSNISNISQGW